MGGVGDLRRSGRPAIPPAAVLAAAVGLAAAGQALGAGTSAGLIVAATVRPYARLEAASAPGTLVVTARDAARGYVDVAAGGSYTVRANARHWVIEVEIAPEAGIIAAEVEGLGEHRRLLGSRGGRILRQAESPSRTTLAPSWRFHLVEGSEPGVRDWPVRLRVAAR